MIRLFLLPYLLLAATLAGAADIPAEIESCMRQNLPQTTSMQSIELRVVDRSHYEQILESDIFLKRFSEEQARVMMYFHEPVDIRGARFLIIEKQPQNDMYIYMPSLFKVRRVTSKRISSSIMGTDFSYEDFERIHGMLTDISAKRLPDETLAGRSVFVLESFPEQGSGYSRVATYIDKQTCIPLQTDLFEHGDQLRKQMTVAPDDIKQTGDIWYTAQLLMKDLRDKTQTTLFVKDIRIDTELDDGLFDPEQLKQVDVPTLEP
ncbi:MAG: outer membrane lipoprotein-sorting protein [Gammaproteobacteria bacterium]|nr:outer membrane lipoprotein-sorting protein [Gammaproteobacteria bacterium]